MDGINQRKGHVDKYIGAWRDHKPHGKGTLIYVNGDKLLGEWMDGKPHGEGALIKAHQLDANETTNPEPQYEEKDKTL